MKIAAVNWKLREVSREEEFYDHLRELLSQCEGCDIVVLPELFSLELLALSTSYTDSDIPSLLVPHYFNLFGVVMDWSKVATTTYVVGGSHVFQATDDPRHFNCAPTFVQGSFFPQFKVILTEWERAIGISAGAGLHFWDKVECATTICLDAEFPASGRALAEAGMLFQCVPAWTETMHGFHRVRTACRARAVENQVCVIHSSLVGQVGNEKCVGSSAIIVPPHEPFPENPILAETPMNEEGIAFAEVAPEDLLRCREMGEVRNWRDRDAGDWRVNHGLDDF
jgi:predicted amidohydrolase